MRGWRADGAPILMPLVRDVLLLKRPAALVPKRIIVRVERGKARLLS